MGDDDVWFALEVGCGGGAGGDDAVHFGDEVFGEFGMVSLGGGGEGDF